MIDEAMFIDKCPCPFCGHLETKQVIKEYNKICLSGTSDTERRCLNCHAWFIGSMTREDEVERLYWNTFRE